MGPLRIMTAAALIGAMAPSPGTAAEGRYTGSYFHSTGADDGNTLRQRLDLLTRNTLRYGMDLDLRLNLNYQSRPGESDTDLLKSRIFGDLRKGNALRFTADFSPWQDASPGANATRARNLQFGLHATPRRAPGLTLLWTRRDQETPSGIMNKVTEGRARLSYGTGGLSSALSYRYIDNEPGAESSFTSRTQEWRGNVNAHRNWSNASLTASYEGLYSDFERQERDRQFYTNRFNATAVARPFKFMSVSANSLWRVGKTEDNALAADQDIDERAVSGRVEVNPMEGLTVSASRTYRTREYDSGQGPLSDYWQAHAKYTRSLVPRVTFQLGGAQTRNLSSTIGSSPTNSAYTILDGRLRKGIFLRTEFRVAQDSRVDTTSSRWQSLVQLRLLPTRTSRAEVNWREVNGAEILGRAQRDHLWDFLFSYRPVPDAEVTASYKTLNGEGRFSRQEDYWSTLLSWRLARTSRLSANWSRRDTDTNGFEKTENVAGANWVFWPVPNWRAKLSWNYVTGNRRVDQTVYGLSVETRF